MTHSRSAAVEPAPAAQPATPPAGTVASAPTPPGTEATQTPADELRAAATKLRASIAVDGPIGLCPDCGTRAEPEPDMAALLAARESLAAWLENMLDTYSSLKGGRLTRRPLPGSNLGFALAIARAINSGGTR